MLKQEINNFRMDIGDFHGLSCSVPCSRASVLLEHGLIDEPYYGDNFEQISRFSDKECVLTADFSVDTATFAMAHILLRAVGARECSFELNGSEIGRASNPGKIYTFDIKNQVRLGTNSLKLTFSPSKSDKPFGGVGYADVLIYRQIQLLAFSSDMIEWVDVRQVHEEGTVRINLSIKTYAQLGTSRAVATLVSPGGNVYYCGMSEGSGSITVNDPNLWWPNRLGMQNLYKLTVNLYVNTEIEDTREIKIGLRSFSVSDSSDGTSVLSVNGQRFFAMGADYLPEDYITSRISRDRTRRLVSECAGAGFNTLRVFGGAYFPDDYFYELCDSLGIVVLQDLPLDGQDMNAVLENLRRIRLHPSLGALLTDTDAPLPNPLGSLSGDICVLKSGVPYDKDFLTDYDGKCEFSDARFPVELASFDSSVKPSGFGLSSLPNIKTLRSYTGEGELNLFSSSMEKRAGMAGTLGLIKYASFGYRYASGLDELSYVSQLMQATSILGAVGRMRRGRDAYFGAIVSQLNEPWPCASRSLIDYSGNRKAAYYFAKRFFAPTRIFAVNNGTRVEFNLSNEQRYEYNGKFTYSVNDSSNRCLFKDSFPISVGAMSSADILSIDLSELLLGHEREYYVAYSIADGLSVTSKGTLLLTLPKYFEYKKPNIRAEINGSGTHFAIVLSSDVYAGCVEIGFETLNARFEDNYFDIIDSSTVRLEVELDSAVAVETLRRELRVRSLYDIGR